MCDFFLLIKNKDSCPILTVYHLSSKQEIQQHPIMGSSQSLEQTRCFRDPAVAQYLLEV